MDDVAIAHDTPAHPGSEMPMARRVIVDAHGALVAYQAVPTAARKRLSMPTAPAPAPDGTDVPVKPTFVGCSIDDLVDGALAWLEPARVVLELRGLPDGPEDIAVLRQARAAGFALAFEAHVLKQELEHLAALANYIVLPMATISLHDAAPIVRTVRSSTKAVAVATHVRTPMEYRELMDAGVSMFEGSWYLQPQVLRAESVPLGYAGLIQLLNLVSKDAEIEEIEALLQREPTLSFKLLSHINSCGFGYRVEISSFRHAVMLMGLKRLFKWTAILVARAPPDAVPPAVGALAIVRGRLAEQLLLTREPDADSDAAFITGMFSLMGCLLGMRLEDTLAKVSLPAEVNLALLEGEGPMVPYLIAAQAAEGGDLATLAIASERLGIPVTKILQLHGQALAWAERLGN